MALPKWDEARLAQLVAYVGNEEPVSIQTVNAAAVELETTARSIAAKLRKEGYDVEKSATVGQGRIRMALVAQPDECLEAARRIVQFVQTHYPSSP